MLFKDVIGQDEIKSRLIRTVQDQRISHAQMLFGPAGTGKLPLAIAYAQFIHCRDRGDEDACGTCPSCVKYAKLVHPDLHFSFPVVKKTGSTDNPVSDLYLGNWRETLLAHPYMSENQWYEAIGAENKQGLISRFESNSIIRKLNLKSYEGEYKILIMWLAEKMHPAAANSLLKLIEEPPDKTLFLLISENTDAILPTILSRTQLIRCLPVENRSMKKGLLAAYPNADDLVDDVVRRSNGDYSLAVRIMEDESNALAYLDDFIFLMRKCYGREIIEISGWIDKIAGLGREKLKDFLAYCLRMIRENFMLNLGQDAISFLSAREEEFSRKFSAFIHPGNAAQMAAEFEKAISHVEANGFARLVLLDLSIRIILLLKRESEAA